MYFSILFLLLLTFKFMQLQPIPPPTEDTLIPYGYKYTDTTETFLRRVTENFKIPIIKKLKMKANNLLKFIREYDYCKTELTRTPPFYALDTASKISCESWCKNNNENYVLFLNENISKIKYLLFEDESFILTLNTTNSNTGGCVHNEIEKKFHCLCKVSYQIIVNRIFYLTFLHTVNGTLYQDQNTSNREQFSALAILLKFYPQSAVFYIAYLLHNHSILSKRTQFTQGGLIDDEIILENVDGMVKDRGIFKDYGADIFKTLYDSIACKTCDIKDVAEKYYSIKQEIRQCIVILTYQVLLNVLLENYST